MGKELAEKNFTSSGELVKPSYIEVSAEGLENLRDSDILMPRLQLMQGTSELVKAGKAIVGTVHNSITGDEIISRDQTLSFIPLYHTLLWVEFKDIKEGGGIVGMDINPSGALAQLFKRRVMITRADGRTELRVTEFHQFFVVLPALNFEDVFILSCGRTNHKHGRKLLNLAKMRKAPLYAGVYNLSTAEQSKGTNTWRVFNFANNGWVDKSDLPKVKNLYQRLRTMDEESKINLESTVEGGEKTVTTDGDEEY